jgi:hypothetical protein
VLEPAHLGELVTWVLDEEARIRGELLISWKTPTDHWLLGLASYNPYAAVWQSTTVQVLRAVVPTMPPSVSSVLQTIISKIDDQS